MKTLVVIANFGTKNEKYLKRVLEEYRAMKKYEIDIVVLSDIPKYFGQDIEVVVGISTKDPWSLPYGHKVILSERSKVYELFVYSEDDTLITENNIDSYLKITQVLPDEYIGGFIRYEVTENGTKYFPDFYNRFHWDPNSVRKIDEYVFAHYTNEHSACFIMTQRQLEKAINSGGFHLPPRIGRYGMPETAATDPYTRCGMKKLICISHLKDFCIHHLPNIYIGIMGLSEELAYKEIEKLKLISRTNALIGPLLETETMLENAELEKRYYEPCREDILSLIPKGIQRVLSVGCSCGSTESELVKQGIEVVGIPLDCVIQVTAEARGIKVVSPDFERAMADLREEDFDCILFPDVLQHLQDPVSVVRNFLNLLRKSGSIVISVPNFHYPPTVRKKMLWNLLLSKANGTHIFMKYKIHFTTRSMIDSWAKKCGMKVVRSSGHVEPGAHRFNRLTMGSMKSILSRNVVVLCNRTVA